VLEDGSVRERLGVAGRARSALFGVDAMAAATGALYREIGS
jgi:hypothetical protein